MTDDEKNAVNGLAASGMGYKRIASLTGISGNTVRSHLRRHPVDAVPVPAASACKHCGKAIGIVPKRKPRLFCSDACRMAHWQQENRAKRK